MSTFGECRATGCHVMADCVINGLAVCTAHVDFAFVPIKKSLMEFYDAINEERL